MWSSYNNYNAGLPNLKPSNAMCHSNTINGPTLFSFNNNRRSVNSWTGMKAGISASSGQRLVLVNIIADLPLLGRLQSATHSK